MARSFTLLLLSTALVGCAPARLSSSLTHRQRQSSFCLYPLRASDALLAPPDRIGPAQLARLRELPREHQVVARVAVAGGLELPEGNDPVAWRSLAERLLRRVPLLEMEVSSAWTAADCLGDQLEDLRMEAVEVQRRKELQWSAISVVVGGLGALLEGVLDLVTESSKSVPIATIVGGVASAGFAAAALKVPVERISLRHERNPLRAIWLDRNEAHLVPHFTWYMLQIPEPGASTTPREQLIERWNRLIDENAGSAEERKAVEDLLFGNGGEYTLAQVELREALFDLLETEFQSFHQAIYLVSAYVSERE